MDRFIWRNSTLPNETDYLAYLLFRPQQNSLLIGGACNGSMTLGTNTLYGSHGFMAELGLNGTFNWSKSLDYSCLCVDEDGYIFTQLYTFSQDHYLDTMWVSAGLWFAKFDTETQSSIGEKEKPILSQILFMELNLLF
ncbi:MAG: hypothetical protein IPG90_15595 [Bacteroidetes bacterium]|nr:hypothetical protein [Bacteroidota bacterium]